MEANRAKLWNDNTVEFVDKWRDMDIRIPAGGFIEMDRGDAVLYRGEYRSPEYTADGAHKIQGFKKLRMEDIPNEVPGSDEETDWNCVACGFNARSKWELEGHVADLHVDQLLDPKEAAKIKGKKKG